MPANRYSTKRYRADRKGEKGKERLIKQARCYKFRRSLLWVQYPQRCPAPSERVTFDKLDELWCVEYGLIEEGYSQSVELRIIDASYEVLPIFGNPLNVNEVRTETTERDSRGGY